MTFREFWQPLTTIYPEDEARWVGRMVFEVKYALTHADLLMGKETSIEESGLLELQQRLLTGEPVQYVLGEAPFGEHLFKVSPAVLIPRPETLWLCNAIATEADGCDVLDIGTGSGCWDVIVSNPPYICEQEKAAMERNVLDFEPHLALFVPDADPLRFYRAIGQYAVKALRPNGRLYLEINPLYAAELSEMLQTQGFDEIRIHQDDNHKDRYIVAWKQRNQ